ncbi:hypothetical protein Cob_v002924 [Colletotrichum orbiculare MAFF 240422]|uniref:Uncharacterized protein n=1 Tax=Colletotrichum orbiculare (strain 104-T / ATCC 96160 / CBS 514.97 / LARS 414 / MAFF 240422) TaxID=1213857 RepID=A0A484G0G7_COLOR|nr:hypothetical protein Cob_v002924 [Colletotrichum orbiculare MAFF 240422]
MIIRVRSRMGLLAQYFSCSIPDGKRTTHSSESLSTVDMPLESHRTLVLDGTRCPKMVTMSQLLSIYRMFLHHLLVMPTALRHLHAAMVTNDRPINPLQPARLAVGNAKPDYILSSPRGPAIQERSRSPEDMLKPSTISPNTTSCRQSRVHQEKPSWLEPSLNGNICPGLVAALYLQRASVMV